MKKTSGTVFLVGAGPGDPGLITVRGLELVKEADVIVHDQLGARSFLGHAKPGAELIDAGKKGGDHTLPQDNINMVLVDKARAGKMVVRLKGGDPMVFGRGGEEMEFLRQHGIDFEAVPGVSSAISGPTYAGIPLTHRDFTSEVAFVTGHEADAIANERSEKSTGTQRSPIPWRALAEIRSLVFLMGVKQLPAIVANLLKAGKAPSVPVAIIESATTHKQRTITGSLENIVQRAQEAGIKPPSLIVVGEGVKLREQLCWFERRPLFGKTIAVTRSRLQASDLVRHLENLGANVLPCPVIRIEKLFPNPAFDDFMAKFATYSHLVFTSVNGVDGFFENLIERQQDTRSLHGKSIICIGPATAEACKKYGIIADFTPTTYVAESLLPYFQDKKPASVAILRAEQAREILPEALQQQGWQVSVIPLYRTIADQPEDRQVIDLLKQGKVDAVTFTSSSTVDRFIEMLAGTGIEPGSIPGMSIGPVTTKTCQEHGVKLLATAREHTIPGLVQELLEFFHS